MKTILTLLLVSIVLFLIQARVKGYTKKNETYVAPHYKSKANNTQYDNYSTKGNINPYTEKIGSKRAKK